MVGGGAHHVFVPGAGAAARARVPAGGVRGAARAVVHLAARAPDVEHVAPAQRRRVVEDRRYRALREEGRGPSAPSHRDTPSYTASR